MILWRKCFNVFYVSRAIRCHFNHKPIKLNFCSRAMNTDIVWIDLEITGLNLDEDKIIEVGCLITDADLKVKSSYFHKIIHQPDELLNGMNEWCIETHGKSGLTEAVKKSNVTMTNAENELLNFIKKYIKDEKTCPLAGNTIYMDHMFLQKQMPSVTEYLHYNIIDVSSIKQLAKRWYPIVFANAPEKKKSHRVIDDIKDSIEELIYYRNNIFKR